MFGWEISFFISYYRGSLENSNLNRETLLGLTVKVTILILFPANLRENFHFPK